MTESCLFCNQDERNYKPPPDAEFVCGSCVQKFLQMDKDKLSLLLEKLQQKKNERAIRAVRIFYKGES